MEYNEMDLLTQALIADDIMRLVTIYRNDDSISVKSMIDSLETEYHQTNNMISSPGFLLGLFYIVCVILNNRRGELKCKESYIKDAFEISEDNYSGSIDYNEIKVGSFLRHIRNSIAHFRVTITKDLKFTFVDKRDDNADENFHLELPFDGTMNLLHKFIDILCKDMTDKKLPSDI